MSAGPGFLFPGADEEARSLATGLSWLWRLGPLREHPAPEAIGVGGGADAESMRTLVATGELGGAVLIGADPDDGATLVLEASPESAWGGLEFLPVLDRVADYLAARLDRPLVLLPAIGMFRLDDLPGTAQLQLEERASGDRRQSRRLSRWLRRFAASGAVLNAAVPANALDGDGEWVPLDRIWPASIEAMSAGVRSGALEPVCHGMRHVDVERTEPGAVEFREFGHLSEDEASSRVEEASRWQADAMGRAPGVFVAPAWTYSDAAHRALDRLGMPRFVRPQAFSVYENLRVYETLLSVRAVKGLDYRPITGLARAGLPPTIVFHGATFDARITKLREERDLVSLARLFLTRDIMRLPRAEGVRWVGASEYCEALQMHDATEWRDGELHAPAGATPRLMTPAGVSERP